jgi:hypothetical protein
MSGAAHKPEIIVALFDNEARIIWPSYLSGIFAKDLSGVDLQLKRMKIETQERIKTQIAFEREKYGKR